MKMTHISASIGDLRHLGF